ncbi:MAG: short chain dehydrogenase, partial [Betaproteobacteria bacterium]|nr:short chain dehydrogenase [Betaproteobacteria bacterium]
GKAAKIDPVNKDEVMSVDECARIIEDAIVSRKREEIMTLKGKIGQWIKLIAPGVVDGLAKKAVAGNLKYVEKK